MNKKIAFPILLFIIVFSSLSLFSQKDSLNIFKRGLYVQTDVGRLLGETYNPNQTYFTINTNIGYRIYPFLSVELGAGIEYINLDRTYPIHGMVKSGWKMGGITPYLFYKGGIVLPEKFKIETDYDITHKDVGSQHTLGIGASVSINQHLGLSLSAGYRHEVHKSKVIYTDWWYYYGQEEIEKTEIYNRVEVKIGLILM